MKISMKAAMVAVLLFIGLSGYSQEVKIGYISVEDVLKVMPEKVVAQTNLQAFGKELEDQMQTMQVEYNNKVADYMKVKDSISVLIRQSKEEELQILQERIQKFQASAQEEFGKKQNEVLKPVMDKATNAIKLVAKENGFTLVFDPAQILYYSDKCVDLLPLVKAKLGIK